MLSHSWPGALVLGGAWCGFGAGDSSFCLGKISVSSFRFFDSVSGALIFGEEAGRWIMIV